MKSLPVGWFDFVFVGVLLAGILRGRKRGMSEELLDCVQWVVMVFGAAYLYRVLGDYIGIHTGFQKLISLMLGYTTVLVVVKCLFIFLKRVAGEKLVGSDLFGSLEYYLGMVGCMIRFACVLIVALAYLNARLIPDAEHNRQMKEQDELYGSRYFPTLGVFQRAVFRDSFVGPYIDKHLEFLLIEPTLYADILDKRDGFGGRKEREIDEVLGGGKRR